MSTTEQPRSSVPKLMTLNRGLELAKKWVNNMPGDAEDVVSEFEIEGRPAGLGLGAKVARKSQFGPSDDSIERKLVKQLGVGRKKPVADQESPLPAKGSSDSDGDDDENLESRTNAFARKRAGPQIMLPLANRRKKQNC